MNQSEKPCWHCEGTGKCKCISCLGPVTHKAPQKGACIICRPTPELTLWRNLPTYEARLGPPPIGGAETHTPTQRYVSFLPSVKSVSES